jgi:hypothetical protein
MGASQADRAGFLSANQRISVPLLTPFLEVFQINRFTIPDPQSEGVT